MSDDVQVVQQVVVPAYVWQDPAQRQAVVTRAAKTLAHRIMTEGLILPPDLGDAKVHPTFMQAQVGRENDVTFVAYETCDPGMADLVFIQLVQIARMIQPVGEGQPPQAEENPPRWSCDAGWFGERPELGVETFPCGAMVTDTPHERHGT